jgi:hypothetical protein
METITRRVTYAACPVFLDDIFVSRTFQEQLDNLWKVFYRF